jgi:hypothetical protein
MPATGGSRPRHAGYRGAVGGALFGVICVGSLAVAGWAAVAAVRDRPPGRGDLVAMVGLELLLLVQAADSGRQVAAGARPAEPATFVGYLVMLVLLPPAAAVLARMEPTRWGSVILAAAALVVPVLMVRLHQVWDVRGG